MSRTDAGGSRAAGGFSYQKRVTAWFAVRMLTGARASGVHGLYEGPVLEVLCETDDHVDDLRVGLPDAVQNSGQLVTVARLARHANVSRSWLYTQPDLIAAARQLMGGQAQTRRSTPATERSLQIRLATALARNQRLQQRIDTLTEQNNRQRQQLERAYAEIRRLQALTPAV